MELSVLKVKLLGETRVPRMVNRLLFPNEKIAFAMQGIRDMVVFTDTRILYMDYRQVTGKSVEYATYMYKDVISYSIVTPGFGLDCDSEVVLRFINREVVQLTIDKGHNLDRFLEEGLGVPVFVAENALDCVAEGCGIMLENTQYLK